ncbi:MAG: DUF1801 domain-containing protein [Proteobacteria bacterium]|nr:DUF1801 domain-containing protein [Pseudomonadota bacterium]
MRKPSKVTRKQPRAAAASRRHDWRREMLARLRALIHQADPQAVEEAKWKKAGNPAGVPTWTHHGIICTGETYQDKIKLTFARGAALEDPSRLFNSGLAGGTRRAIDIYAGDKINEAAFKELIREAVALNKAKTTGNP